jgi:hypothetical protein
MLEWQSLLNAKVIMYSTQSAKTVTCSALEALFLHSITALQKAKQQIEYDVA